MSRVDVCTNCGEVKEIRRRSGQCDACYHKEYNNRPEVNAKIKARSAAWKRQHNEHVKAYNKHYYESMKGNNERSSGPSRGAEVQD